MGLLDTCSASEVSLGLAHLAASQEERVRAYYNYILDFERDKKTTREGEAYLRATS